MLKLKLQYLCHLMRRTDSLEKTLMLGKIEDRRRGWQRMGGLDGITDWMGKSLGKLQELWWTGMSGVLQFVGSQRVGHDWAIELNLRRCCWMRKDGRDSWPPEEKNSIRARDEGWSLRVLCNKVWLKYKGDRESFWHRHQKGAERVPPCESSAGCYIVTRSLLMRPKGMS